jgi:hypothetical protein
MENLRGEMEINEKKVAGMRYIVEKNCTFAT